MAKHWFPFFKPEKCIHCGNCISACPSRLLYSKTDENRPDLFFPKITDPELCPVNCFDCVRSCPRDVIGIIRPARPCDCCSF
ncbi:4Fe-4S dicluster domain-containing protein [Methanolapillus ohkumae]|uniref:4Fe-4S dicluster domain-containing protein n=1 Tax=Methanolapillus ohkumae TaxID=3028298 RepID=UPI003B847137